MDEKEAAVAVPEAGLTHVRLAALWNWEKNNLLSKNGAPNPVKYPVANLVCTPSPVLLLRHG